MLPEHAADQWIQISLLCCLREVLRSWGLPAISAQSLVEGFDRLARSRATRPVPASAKRKVSVRRSSGSSSLGVAASRETARLSNGHTLKATAGLTAMN